MLDALKRDPALRDIPVIMISAVDDHESVIRCIEAGADQHLPKPFDPVLLRARINAGLARRACKCWSAVASATCWRRFLPEPVVQELLAQGAGDPRLGGVRVEATVMFCDLRGFTPFAESTPPDRVIAVLNRYLAEMTDAVLDAAARCWRFSATASSPSSVRRSPPRITPTARSRRRGRCCGSGCRRSTLDGLGRLSASVPHRHRPEQRHDHVGERRLGAAAREHGRNRRTRSTPPRASSSSRRTTRSPRSSPPRRTSSLTMPADDLTYVDDVVVRGRASATALWGLA